MSAPVPGRISVVIPVYNGARYILEGVQSIRDQDHPDTEIILVDDGSTDESWSVISALDDARTIQQENQGPGAARNRGVQEATGEFLCFLDQDDLWITGKSALQQAKLQVEPELGYVLAHTMFSLLDGHARPNWARDKYFEQDHPGFVVGAMMVRRSTFDVVGPFRTHFKAGVDDVDWFVRSQQCGVKRAMMPETLLNRRLHDENFSQNTAQSSAELLRIIRSKVQAAREGRPS